MPAGKIQPFDPTAFTKLQTDLKKQQQAKQAVAASQAKRQPALKPPPKASQRPIAAGTGLASRKKLANDLQNTGF